MILVVFIERIRQRKKTYLTFYRHPFLVRHSTIHRKSIHSSSAFWDMKYMSYLNSMVRKCDERKEYQLSKKIQSTSAATGGVELIQRLLRHLWSWHVLYLTATAIIRVGRQAEAFWTCFWNRGFERFHSWSMSAVDDEPIEGFLLRG